MPPKKRKAEALPPVLSPAKVVVLDAIQEKTLALMADIVQVGRDQAAALQRAYELELIKLDPGVRTLTLSQYRAKFKHDFPYAGLAAAKENAPPAASPPPARRRGVQFSPSAASPPRARAAAPLPDRTVVRPGGGRAGRAPPAAATAGMLTTTIKPGRGRAPAAAAFCVPLPDGTTLTLDPMDDRHAFTAALTTAKEHQDSVVAQVAAVMRSAQEVLAGLGVGVRRGPARGAAVSRGSLSAPGTE